MLTPGSRGMMWGPDYMDMSQRVLVDVGLIASDEYLEYFCYNWEDASIAASSGAGTIGAYQDTAVRLDQESDFLLMALNYQATDDRAMVRLVNQSTGQFIFSKECEVGAIAGQAVVDSTFATPTGRSTGWNYTACPFPVPIRIPGGTVIVAQKADFSGAGNALYLSGHGAKVRKGMAPWFQGQWKRREFFVYTDTIAVPANGVAPLTFPIHQDAHFVCYSVNAAMDGNATIQIKDGGTDRVWMDRAMRIRNMTGFGRFSHVLEAPRMSYRNTSIAVTLADLSGSTNNIRVHMLGEKLYL